MAQGEESHLGEEVVAGSEMIAECGEQKGEAHLPGAQPQGGDEEGRYTRCDLVGNVNRKEKEYDQKEVKACD